MSSAPARILQPLGRVLRGTAWALLLAVLAASAAGLIGASWHAPGSPARAELTYTGDTTLDARLDAATEELGLIVAQVDQLAQEAKTALGEVASADPTRLREALLRGGLAATAIETRTRDLRESLVGLSGDGPAAAIEYSNATLVRRASILAAIDAGASLAAQWRRSPVAPSMPRPHLALDARPDRSGGGEGPRDLFKEATLSWTRRCSGSGSCGCGSLPGRPHVLDEWTSGPAYAALRRVYTRLTALG
jgi:hypothetical protein